MRRTILPLALLALFLADTLPVRTVNAQPRASLSADLQRLVSNGSGRRSRVRADTHPGLRVVGGRGVR